jgi:hypothetical protein
MDGKNGSTADSSTVATGTKKGPICRAVDREFLSFFRRRSTVRQQTVRQMGGFRDTLLAVTIATATHQSTALLKYGNTDRRS